MTKCKRCGGSGYINMFYGKTKSGSFTSVKPSNMESIKEIMIDRYLECWLCNGKGEE